MRNELLPERPSFATEQDNPFFDRLEAFSCEQVPRDSALDNHTRALTMLAVTTGMGATEEFRRLLPVALKLGLEPEASLEIVYQAAAYLGTGYALPLLEVARRSLADLGITTADVACGPTEEDARRTAGTAAQVGLWGEAVSDFYKVDLKNYWVTTHIFGDYYTRGCLTLAQRALVSFCFLYAMGGVEHELKGYVLGNEGVGNDLMVLGEVVRQNVPYVGFPRSLAALKVLASMGEEQ